MLLGVETRATDHSTFRFSAGYCSNQSVTGSYDINNNYLVFQRSGFSVEAQFRRFIGQSAKVFQGIYFGPYIQFKHQQIEYEDWDPTWGRSLSRSSGSASCTVAGYLIGKYIPINEQFALDLWVGQGMYFSSGKYEVADRLMDGFHNAIRINGGIALGIGL